MDAAPSVYVPQFGSLNSKATQPGRRAHSAAHAPMEPGVLNRLPLPLTSSPHRTHPGRPHGGGGGCGGAGSGLQ